MSDMVDRRDDAGREPDIPVRRNWVEWGVLSLGICIVLFTLGYLIREIVVATNEVPILTISTGDVIQVEGTYYVPVIVENLAGSVASDANVEVCGETGECAEMSFDFVPRRSTRKGTVGFSRHPGTHLTSRITGYRIP